jgi:Tfp pilus assembly protein PilF
LSMADRSRGTSTERSRGFQLIAPKTVNVVDTGLHSVFGGQYLRIPAGSRLDVDIEAEVLGEDGQMMLVNNLVNNAGGKDAYLSINKTPPLNPGDTIELSYSYYTGRELTGVNCRLFSRKLWGGRMKLGIKKAQMAIMPIDDLEGTKTGTVIRAYAINGRAYTKEELIDRKIEQYNVALKHVPDSADFHMALGSFYGAKGLLDKAIGQYEAAVKLNPSDRDVRLILGTAYGRRGMLDKSIGQYEAALRLDPSDPDSYINLGAAYAYMGMLDKSIEYYQAALRLDPESILAHYELSDIYAMKGLRDKAVEQRQRAESLKNR